MAKLKISQVQLWSKNTRLLTVAQNRFQKRTLHEHHIKRKRCRLLRRQDIIDAFWNVYEQEAFNRLNELINDLSVANEPIHRYVFDAILSMDKIEIIKLWREKCMFLFPQVEQHQMVPFHDRWIQSQFKEERNVAKMKERLCVRAKASTHWFSQLGDELTVFPWSPSVTGMLFWKGTRSPKWTRIYWHSTATWI